MRRARSAARCVTTSIPLETATFLVALYEGYISLAKNAQEPAVLRSGLRTIVRHLETLRAPR